ncbi:hypothetical protein pdam_00024692, partial [Pocillopora damicornis]
MLIGRNVPTAFQSLKVIYGEADEPWAEKYKFGWTIIGPVCLDKAKPQQCCSVSVNRVTVQREELPDSCILNVPQASNPLHQQDSVAVLVNKLRSKDTNTCFLTHSTAREYPGLLLSYLNRVSSWHKAKTTVAWMRRGIKNLQSVIAARKEEIHPAKDLGRSRNEQGKQFLPLSVEELVHSE